MSFEAWRVERNIGLARRCAQRMRYGGEDYDAVESDAMLGLWRAARTYRVGRDWTFEEWAWLVIRRTIIDGRRIRIGSRRWAGGKYRRAFEAVDPDTLLHIPTHSDFTWPIMIELLGLLNERQAVIALLDMEGWNGRMIGAHLGITEGRVCQIRAGAKALVRAALAGGDTLRGTTK